MALCQSIFCLLYLADANLLFGRHCSRRDGKDLGFFELVNALVIVYNISWLLACLLTLAAFVTTHKITFNARSPTSPKSKLRWSPKLPLPRLRLDLGSLSIRGSRHIAHDASFVHPNFVESHSPDQHLLNKFLTFASTCGGHQSGLSLVDIAHYHEERENELHSPLDNLHKQIALGECGLGWAVMRKRSSSKQPGGADDEQKEVIPVDVLKTWFGCERLPEDWWGEGGSRPVQPIGFAEARNTANDVAKIIAKC